MSLKGGYQILDLKKVPFTSGTSEKIPGAFNALEHSNGKRVIVSGLVIDGDSTIAFPDITTIFLKNSGSYSNTFVVGEMTITILVENDDDVTITVTTE